MSLTLGSSVPALELETVGGTRVRLADFGAVAVVAFYAGLHSEPCRAFVQSLDGAVGALQSRGVGVIVASCDVRERAERARREWGLRYIVPAFGLGLGDARAWGLRLADERHVTALGLDTGPFTEPAVFVVSSDGTLYWGVVSTAQSLRPGVFEILAAVDQAARRHKPAERRA